LEDKLKSYNNYEKIMMTNNIIKDIMPYSNKSMRNVFTGAEAMLNILENIYGMNKGLYKKKAESMMSLDIPNRPIKVLEAAVPYLNGNKQDRVIKFLAINDQMNHLRKNKGSLLEKGKGIVEILDTANVKQIRDMKQKVNMIRSLMKYI